MPGGRHNIGGGINENGPQAGIIVRIAMQQKQAGEGGDNNLVLIAESHFPASFKILFSKENLDAPLQFAAVLLRQLKIEEAVRFNDFPPLRRKRNGLQLFPS